MWPANETEFETPGLEFTDKLMVLYLSFNIKMGDFEGSKYVHNCVT